jgi:hypothetical protein
MRPTRIHASGLAFAADGTVLVNIAHWASSQDPLALLQRAKQEGGEIFIGVQLAPREAKEALRWLDNGAAEAVAHIGGRRQRRRRGKERRKTRSGS